MRAILDIKEQRGKKWFQKELKKRKGRILTGGLKS